MTEKRYYEKDYDELYYIFDSKTLSEKEFEKKVEYDGYSVFADSLTSKEVVDLLNENEQLKKRVSDLQKENYGNIDGIAFYQEENASLCEKISDLECENEELKKENYKLHKRLGDFEPFEKYIKERTSKISVNDIIKTDEHTK